MSDLHITGKVIVSDAVPDGDVWIVDAMQYQQWVNEYLKTHHLAIDGPVSIDGVYHYTARMVPNSEAAPPDADTSA